VLVILLLVAAGVSTALWAFERDAALPYEAIAIFAVVVLNATMGFLQESRTEAAVVALCTMFAVDASVIRGGERQSVHAVELVTGDVIVIEEGDTIPADGRLIESASLRTSEAALTGESMPVSKDTASIADEVPLGDRDYMVFSGTAAPYGHGKAIVTATGMRSEMGRIAGLLKDTPDESTPLQRELDRTGKMLGLVVVTIAVLMIVTIVVVEDVRGVAVCSTCSSLAWRLRLPLCRRGSRRL
jgi:Ca2+-transporting ATPase